MEYGSKILSLGCANSSWQRPIKLFFDNNSAIMYSITTEAMPSQSM